MNKHILIVSQYFYPENFRINDIASEWIKKGYKVTVITGIPNYPNGKFFKGYGFFKRRKEEYNGIKIVRLPIFPRLNNAISLIINYYSFRISGWFWAKFTRIKADIVFNFGLSPTTQATVAINYAKRRKIPCYTYIQDLWPDNLQAISNIKNKFVINQINKTMSKIYKDSTKILVTSESFKNTIINRNVDSNKIIVWHQYAEDFYKPIEFYNRYENILKIVFTGNIGEAQGLDILPKLAKRLKELNVSSNVKFIIVGDGRKKKELINEVQILDVSDMFEFKGYIPPQDIPNILAQSKVAFLSFKDNDIFSKTIPAKLQSYLACGMPILGIVSGESKRIIEEAGCGFVSLPGNFEEAVENVIKFLNLNDKDFEKMRKNSRLYSQINFDKSRLLDDFDRLIMEDLKNV